MPRIIDSHVPIGSIQSFAANANTSGGWIYCNGQAVSRSTYAALFATIGTVWGIGDGLNTFNVPNFKGKFLRGRDDGAGNDPDAGTRVGGDNVGSTQAHQFGSHNHAGSTGSVGNHSHGFSDPGHSHGGTFARTSILSGGHYIPAAGDNNVQYSGSIPASGTGISFNADIVSLSR